MSGYRLLKTALCGAVLLASTTEVTASDLDSQSSLTSQPSTDKQTHSFIHHEEKRYKKKTVCENGKCRDVVVEDEEAVEDCKDGVCTKRRKHGDELTEVGKNDATSKALNESSLPEKSIADVLEEVSPLLSDNSRLGELMNNFTHLFEFDDAKIPSDSFFDLMKGNDMNFPHITNLMDIIMPGGDKATSDESESAVAIDSLSPIFAKTNLRKGNSSFSLDDDSVDDLLKSNASSFFGSGAENFFNSFMTAFEKDNGGKDEKPKVSKYSSQQSIAFTSKQIRVPVTKEDIEKNPKLKGEKYHHVDASSISCRGKDSKGKEYKVSLSKKVVDGQIVEDVEKTEGLTEEQIKDSISYIFRSMPKARDLFPEVYSKYAV